jgi:hypothetical protein
MQLTHTFIVQGNKNYANTQTKACPVKPSLAFASFFLTIATITCVGSAVMLWDAWNELRAHCAATQKSEVPEVQNVIQAEPNERLSAAAQLAATIRNSSNGTATSHTPVNSATADQRATAWIDSTMR